jgi:RimJ/RimL family protein N-acetyltransferase
MMLTLKDDGLIVGGSGLHRIDWSIPKFEIGYWVRTSHAGQGYITEAVKGIARFAFNTLGAHRVEIRCDVKNGRSAAVARRAGFTLEGTLHNDARDHFGHLRDTYVFARIRE